jgi:NADH-quinone oxidoreductase subunit A
VSGLSHRALSGTAGPAAGPIAEETGRGRFAAVGGPLVESELEKEFTSVSDYFSSYTTVLALALAGAGLVAVALLAARVVAPRRPLPEKLTTYECGIDPVGEGWSQSQIRYYIYAFLFVIFDVESVFLFPWAVVFERLGMYALVSMTIFILILGAGLVYAWRKGVLKWA